MNKREFNKVFQTILKEEGVAVSQTVSNEILTNLLSEIGKTVKEEGELSLSGFGKFVLRGVEAKTARNPQNGEAVEVEAHNVVRFKPFTVLKELVK